MAFYIEVLLAIWLVTVLVMLFAFCGLWFMFKLVVVFGFVCFWVFRFVLWYCLYLLIFASWCWVCSWCLCVCCGVGLPLWVVLLLILLNCLVYDLHWHLLSLIWLCVCFDLGIWLVCGFGFFTGSSYTLLFSFFKLIASCFYVFVTFLLVCLLLRCFCVGLL